MNSVGAPSQDGAGLKAGAGRGRLSAGRLAMAAVLFLYTLCVFIPWNLPLPENEVDASWNVALHWAHLHHVDFGHDLVFPYGPWGFVNLRYMPATFGWVVAAWTVLSVGVFCAAWKIFGRLNGLLSSGVLTAIFVTMAAAPVTMLQDVRMASVCWLLLLLHFYFDNSDWGAAKIILAVGMAWVCLIKFSMSFMAAPILFVVSLDQLLRRRAPSILIVFMGAYLALWMVAGQSLASLGAYLSHSWIVTAGYTEGEGLSGSSDQLEVWLYLESAGALVAALGMIHPWRRYRRRQAIDVLWESLPESGATMDHRKSLLAAVGAIGVLLVLFKAGYVRSDTHQMIATNSLSLLGLAIGAIVWPRVRRPAFKGLVVILCAGGLGVAWNSDENLAGTSPPRLAWNAVALVPGSISTAIDWMTGGSGLGRVYEKQREILPESMSAKSWGRWIPIPAGKRR